MQNERKDELAGACALLLKVRTLVNSLEGKVAGSDDALRQEINEWLDLYIDGFMGDLEDAANEFATVDTTDLDLGFGYNLKKL